MKIGGSIFIWLICINSFFTFRHFESVRCCIQYVQNLNMEVRIELRLQIKNSNLFRYLTKFRFGIYGWIDVLSCDFSHHELDISQFFEVKIALLNIEIILGVQSTSD